MAAATTDTSVFPLFSRLCPELRNQIWRDALPDRIGPVLCSYKKRARCPRRLTESDEEYEPDTDESNLNFEYRHDLSDNVQYDVPLVFVSREARGIALTWVRQQSLEIRPREDRRYPVFERSFDPMRDALYYPHDIWEYIGAEPDSFEKIVHFFMDTTYLAVPEALLRREWTYFCQMIWRFSRFEILFIIVDAPADLQCAYTEMNTQRRWELKSTQGGSIFWKLDSGGFDLGNSDHLCHETLYKLIEEIDNKGLGFELAFTRIASFEIRPVIAVGR